MVKQNDYDLIISDLKMPQMTGDEFLKEVRKFNTITSFIVLTAYGTVDTAVDCMRHGAFDYISKPIDFNDERTWNMIKEAVELSKSKKNTLFYKNYLSTLKNSSDLENIITVNPLMKEILEYLKKIANFDFTVLIYGESGVGKELFAKEVHNLVIEKTRHFYL